MTYFIYMALDKAHKGYEYQDLVTTYFIMEEIINDYNSSFKIDQKEFKEDKFDDLTIIRGKGVLKKQIKYSDNHTLEKSDLSAKGTYNLALDLLYNSWLNNPEKDKIEDVRLCLAWNEPIDNNIINVLKPDNSRKTFTEFETILYKVNLEKLWSDKKPLKSWNRLGVKSDNIDKKLFSKFCNLLIIEIEFPKFSLDFKKPMSLESIILKQTEILGIGVFPNDKTHPIDFILQLLQLVRNCRIKQSVLNTEQVFKKLNITRDFGSIKQVFPINQKENIYVDENLVNLDKYLINNRRVVLVGEPGSGKSWFVNNFIEFLKKKDINVVKHYCYTDLEDEFQKERIKLNVFYGNLISDILKVYPYLSKKKKNKYGSSLSELNELLKNIDKQTVVLIDGLDHIDRIFDYRNYSDISRQDIEIINCLDKLIASEKVKFLVTSQPIDDLASLKTFNTYQVVKWGLKQVKILMKKLSLEDSLLGDSRKKLSQFLLNKSAGNPLYLSFLIKEIKQYELISEDILNSIPDYSFNLESYYSYLLTKLNTREQVPRVLSGVNFALTKSELIEITGDGDEVDYSLKSLASVLKHNFSRSGFIIYHESFRRFIINNLRKKNVDIEKNIFEPISTWFEKKGLFEYQKSYRYYLSFLKDGSKFQKITEFITSDFVFKSLVSGQPWELIEKNYNYLAYASTKNNDYRKIVVVSEINKIVSSTQDTFYELYSDYIEALGNLKGYRYVNDYLSFDGYPTLDTRLGLQTCYLCSVNNFSPLWRLYIDDYFPKGENIDLSDFHLYIRYLIDNKKNKSIISVCSNIEEYPAFLDILKNEISKDDDTSFIIDLKKNKVVSKIYKDDNKSDKNIDINEVCENLLSATYIHDKEVEFIDDLIVFVKQNYQNEELIKHVTKQFENINWFYNWLIFLIKINVSKITSINNDDIIRSHFVYLTKDVEPFKGEPRTTDLYQIRRLIIDSYELGLSLINEDADWKPFIDIMVELSETTTTHMQKSLGGPLPTDMLFGLLKEHSNENNIDYILTILEKQQNNKSDHHLHSYIASYNFIQSQLYSKSGKIDRAEETFELGIKYAIGYTFRKDITLSEIIISMDDLSYLGHDFALDAIKKIKPLVDSVVEHTDGKETKHYPVSWFNTFIKNDFTNSSLYLRHELNSVRYDWRLESSLLNILNELDENIKPIIQLFLLRTFIIESSESYLEKCLDIYELTKDKYPYVSNCFLGTIYIKSQVDKSSTTDFSMTFIERLNNAFQNKKGITSLVPKKKTKKKSNRNYSNAIEFFKSKYKKRKSFNEMKPNEIQFYLSENKIRKNDLNSLCYYFDQFDSLTEDLKKTIIALLNDRLSSGHNPDFEILFSNANKEVSVFYWVCCYIYEKKSWYEELSYVDAFEKAYLIDNELAFTYLNELIIDRLSRGYNVGVSGNLINAFIKSNQSQSLIKDMWHNLYDSINDRLPSVAEYDWSLALDNEENMNIEELFVCILFTRFHSNTVERFQITLAGISYLLYNNPKLLIKPLKWFFKNQSKYLKSILLSVITLIYEYDKENTEYKNHFEKELELFYPQNYFLIDTAIELLYNKKKKKSLLIEEVDLIIHEKVSQNEFDFFIDLNSRHSLLFSMFPNELIRIYNRYKRTYKDIYKDYTEIYYSNSNKTFVDNLYYYDHMLKLINKELYEDLKTFHDQKLVFEDLTVDVRSIVSLNNSLKHRPQDLKHPHSMKQVDDMPFDEDRDWVRIAHVENEKFREESYKDVESYYKSIGAICFNKSKRKELPQVAYLKRIPAKDDEMIHLMMDDVLIYMFLQNNHHLEEYNYIIISPFLMNTFNLKKVDFYNGFHAINESNEIVLKYNSWKANYIGNGHITGLADEVPLEDGAELLVRKDYFDKIKKIYKVQPFYRTITIDQTNRLN